jgi:hypothetical protein
MSQANFDIALYTKFTGSGALATALTNRFHNTMPPPDANGDVLTKLPLLVYTVISDVHPINFDRDDLDVTVQIDLWSKVLTGIEAALTNNDLIVALLNRGTLTMAGVGGITGRLEDRGVPSFEGDAIRILSSYRFVGTGS